MTEPMPEPALHVPGVVTLYEGDSLDLLARLPDASVHAVVTDPPYGLEFMGAEWDSFRERLGVDRAPRWAGERSGTGGGSLEHTKGIDAVSKLPTYGGNRPTTNRCATCGKRDAFRNPHGCGDAAEWIREPVDPNSAPPAMVVFGGWVTLWARECLRVLKPGGHLLAFGGSRTWHRLAVGIEDAGFELRDSIAWLYGSGFPKSMDVAKAIDAHLLGGGSSSRAIREQNETRPGVGQVAAALPVNGIMATEHAEPRVTNPNPATPEAAEWQGWGTALKPAFEPIVVARKPLTGTVAESVLKHGTGALNINATRVAHASAVDLATSLGKNPGRADTVSSDVYGEGRPQQSVNVDGRHPMNVMLDDVTADELDRQNPERPARYFPTFLYEAKAPTSERPRAGEVAHPTVKPLDLMRWLVRLVTPPGGIVLDPFAGSGTTGEACAIEGFEALLMERAPEYVPLIVNRLSKPIQPTMFADLGDE